jgi:hypothetical protein
VQQHAASFVADTEASTGAKLPWFIKDEFNALLDSGILARGFLRLHCGVRVHDRLLTFSCKRRGFVSSDIGPWWKGQDIDPDSASTTWPGDRCPDGAARLDAAGQLGRRSPARGLSDEDLDKLNAKASAPINCHGDRNPRHHTIQDQLQAGVDERPEQCCPALGENPDVGQPSYIARRCSAVSCQHDRLGAYDVNTKWWQSSFLDSELQ